MRLQFPCRIILTHTRSAPKLTSLRFALCVGTRKERDKKGKRKMFLVAEEKRQAKLHQKAIDISDVELVLKMGGYIERIDMIAGDFRYHNICADNILHTRIPKEQESEEQEINYKAFTQLVNEITEPLLVKKQGFYIPKRIIDQILRPNQLINMIVVTNHIGHGPAMVHVYPLSAHPEPIFILHFGMS